MTAAALLTVRLLLAAVFGLAAGSKLAHRDGVRVTLSDFGVPRQLVGAGSLVLPAAELLVAALLVATWTARLGAAAAVVLLAIFSAAMARLLLRGERPDCGCLGRLRATPVGAGTLVRNGALAAVAAAVVVAGPGSSLTAQLARVHASPLAITLAALAALVLAQGCAAAQLLRQHGRLLGRIRALEQRQSPHAAEGPGVGEDAPALVLPDGDTLDDRLASGLPVALVFSNTGCSHCETLAPELVRLREERDGELEIVVLEDDRAALEAYRIFTVPSATIIARDGRVASRTVVGGAAIRELLAA